ncbi:hypothetical protein TNCV_508821 [Trichonephila clavipes]|nr:hypothetical protein TNCV_508821 [Trichonephila clavipes]
MVNVRFLKGCKAYRPQATNRLIMVLVDFTASRISCSCCEKVAEINCVDTSLVDRCVILCVLASFGVLTLVALAQIQICNISIALFRSSLLKLVHCGNVWVDFS